MTHIIDPTHFYVRYVAEHKAGVLLNKYINSICSGERSHFTAEDQIKTGESAQSLDPSVFLILFRPCRGFDGSLLSGASALQIGQLRKKPEGVRRIDKQMNLHVYCCVQYR